MEYRNLGSTGLKVSAIGFGCGPLAGLMVTGSPAERLQTVRLALESGINLFDTAGAYGDGLSETHLGEVLAELGASPVIATKVVLQVEDLADVRGAILRYVEQGLKRLRRATVDVVQLHNRIAANRRPDLHVGVGPVIGLEDALGARGVAEAFAELKAGGVIRGAGFTAFGGEAPAIREAIRSGRFDVINGIYNMLNPSAVTAVPASLQEPDYEQVLGLAANSGMGVTVIRALAAGALAESVAGAGEPRIRRLASLAEGEEPTLTSAALRYVLSWSGCCSAIIGFSSARHVVDAVTAAGRGPLSEQALAHVQSVLHDH